MSRVFVSNIPEKFTPQDLQLLLQQANIPCSYPEPLKILKSKRHKADGSSTGRFIVLNFDQDVVANTAIEAINMMVLTVDQKETSIRAAPFIPNFRSYLENPLSNLVIYNIPLELATNDLKDLFNEFGSVLSAMVKKPMNKKDQPATAAPKCAMGYVLFENKEQADAAMESANGKFLGPNQLYIVKYKTLAQRMNENAEVLLLSIPTVFGEAETKEWVAKQVNMSIEEIFAANVNLSPDTRPETFNSNGQRAIFTCKTRQIALEVIDKINALGPIVLEGVKEPVQIKAKLTRGMLAFQRGQEQQQNKEKYADSGKNVQVFGLKSDVTETVVREFFSRYGTIEQLSAPNRTDVEQNIFHYNILFSKPEEAEKAIREAAKDEKSNMPRLSTSELRV